VPDESEVLVDVVVEVLHLLPAGEQVLSRGRPASSYAMMATACEMFMMG